MVLGSAAGLAACKSRTITLWTFITLASNKESYIFCLFVYIVIYLYIVYFRFFDFVYIVIYLYILNIFNPVLQLVST